MMPQWQLLFLIKEHFLKRTVSPIKPNVEKAREYKKRDFKENNSRDNRFKKKSYRRDG
jgi:hypothetical protein